MNTAIIVAAGEGKRFGSTKPKQFLEILGKPIIIHTLERFENCSAVDEIILVLLGLEIENFTRIAETFSLKKLTKTIAGGKIRSESVFNGLNAVNSEKTKIVAVHDGARPIVSCEEITRTIEKAKETGAACLVANVTDTIKKVSNGKIIQTIDRRNLRRALTPQAFRYEVLKRAFADKNLNEVATDECFLVEKLGVEISTVEGNAQNIKITHAEDLAIAEIFLKQMSDANNNSTTSNI
jgi:2-C-methyl-D-erythritol 4-phosphate cytidylyltransferase